MEPLPRLRVRRAELLKETRKLVVDLRSALAFEVTHLSRGLTILAEVRRLCYERLNQIQHEALLLEAASSLAASDFAGQEVEWSCNARQSGGSNEPDLQGRVGGCVVVSVEVTASDSPEGILDTRMASTLSKLAGMPGKRVYCVRSAKMAKRAETKVKRAGHPIEVRVFPLATGGGKA